MTPPDNSMLIFVFGVLNYFFMKYLNKKNADEMIFNSKKHVSIIVKKYKMGLKVEL
jgi:hypothetical protein